MHFKAENHPAKLGLDYREHLFLYLLILLQYYGRH